jgi:CBS domain-containing protein
MPNAFDARNPPFDRLAAQEIDRLRAELDIGYFAPGETIVAADSPAAFFHVVIKGAVEERIGTSVESVLGPKECFDARALLHSKPGSSFIAAEETLCYLIPRDLVIDLTQSNPGFGAFFYSEISRKLDAMARTRDAQGVDSVLRSRIGDARLQPAVFIDGSATIKTAGHRMQDADTNSLFVHDGERIGVVTGMNLAKAVVLGEMPLDAPIRDVCRFDVVSVGKDDFIFDALILMTRHNKRRLAVRDGDEYVGVLEDIGILGLFAGNSQLIPGRIDRARSIADLASAAADIQSQVDHLHRQDVKVDVIAEITSDLNRRLFTKLFGMIAPESIREKGCLIIMGSEGRGEQTVRTDQDNGLLLSGPVPEADLAKFRADFTEALERFGFPPCPGNVMVRNPQWSQPIEYFIRQLKGWVISPDENSPMNLGIFVDAVGIGLNQELLSRAKATLFEILRGESAYLSHFARAIDLFPGSGGMLNAIMATVGREESIDIKKSGTFPIVHGIRTLSIERGIFETPTVRRIEALANENVLTQGFARELTGSLRFFMEMRLRSQLRAMRLGTIEGESLVKPSELTTLERDLLRDALRVVKEFREFVRGHFNLRMF